MTYEILLQKYFFKTNLVQLLNFDQICRRFKHKYKLTCINVIKIEKVSSMSRRDGRGNEEFRAAFLKTKVLNQAKGSCYIELDQTKVMVGV